MTRNRETKCSPKIPCNNIAIWFTHKLCVQLKTGTFSRFLMRRTKQLKSGLFVLDFENLCELREHSFLCILNQAGVIHGKTVPVRKNECIQCCWDLCRAQVVQAARTSCMGTLMMIQCTTWVHRRLLSSCPGLQLCKYRERKSNRSLQLFFVHGNGHVPCTQRSPEDPVQRTGTATSYNNISPYFSFFVLLKKLDQPELYFIPLLRSTFFLPSLED